MEDPALVVAENDLLVGHAFHVLGIDRDLAAPAGGIDHILRDRVAGGVAPERPHDLDALAE